MSTGPTARERLAELEQSVRLLQAKEALHAEADDALELALRDRLHLARTVQVVLPILLQHVDGASGLLRTYDENLELSDFRAGPQPFPMDGGALEGALGSERFYRGEVGGGMVVGCRLDVAGADFGVAAAWFDRPLDEAELAAAQELLVCWTEVLDNYLASIAWARHKHRVVGRVSAALKAPVLDEGLDAAIDVLREEVTFDDLLLVFRHEDDAAGDSLHYKIIQEGRLTHDASAEGTDVDEFLRNHAGRMLAGASQDLLPRLGITRFREEVMISGVRDERVIGRLIVTNEHGEFSTHDRDLLELFADYLRQRIVDFNREWKHLSLCFPPDLVERLLHCEDYRERYLTPREQEVAILYADLSGFTRLSEQVLRRPALIGRLVDTWSARAVDIIWRSGGVFDKMVGDCVIGLWGPPFFDGDAATLCRNAAAAARRIRDFSRHLHEDERLPELKDVEPPLGVATALHYCPVLVGIFGPNEDYTAFSSGMNCTARLQGVAERDEILCMDEFVRAHGDGAAFGAERSARVKNVAEPLRFRPLR